MCVVLDSYLTTIGCKDTIAFRGIIISEHASPTHFNSQATRKSES
jgi:hypothetical protein